MTLSSTDFGLAAAPLLRDDEPLVMLLDLSMLRGNLEALVEVFPPSTLHAVALKASPLLGVVDEVVRAGCGLEAASPTELELALSRVGADRVVFDSPVKTDTDLRRALAAGVTLNADNLSELPRIAALMGSASPNAKIGLRVNPAVGAGDIEATSTAFAGSKFGVCLATHRAEVLQAFRSYPWLTGLHSHIGSGGCGLDLLVEGVRVLDGLASEVRSAGGRIGHLDIGGGVPLDGSGSSADVFRDYATRLLREVPGIFSPDHLLITEMGRSVHANTTVAVTRVEGTKTTGGRKIALAHVGADLLLRTAYAPDDWRHEITVLSPDGVPKELTDLSPWDVAGPLCFSGDLIARARPLPPIERGDLLMVQQVGAYTLSMWSRYNSRRSPRLMGVEPGSPPVELRRREAHADVMTFWA